MPSNPLGLTYDHKSGFVFVAQPFVNYVTAVDVITGVVVLTIGMGIGELCSPSGVALDGYGNLLVAERGAKRIAVFDASDGTPITSFHTTFEPYSVFVDKNESVIAGGDKGIFMWR